MLSTKTDDWISPFLLVYGTLKNGFSNHRLLEKENVDFVDVGVTDEKFPMIVDKHLPFLFFKPGLGQQIFGELYRIENKEVQQRLDSLEGHPNWYQRRLIAVKTLRMSYAEVYAYFVTKDLINVSDADLQSKSLNLVTLECLK